MQLNTSKRKILLGGVAVLATLGGFGDRKSTRLNSSHT